jgi:hypothetical protein
VISTYVTRHYVRNRIGWLAGVIGVLASLSAVALRRAAPPCCRLTGRWELFLVLDSAALDEKRALARQLSAGALTFTDSTSPVVDRLRDEAGQVRREIGVSALDLSPMLGEEYRPGELTRWLKSIGPEVEASMEKEVLATTFSGDSVEIDTPPFIDHFGVILHGRIGGDSITGRWFQKRMCCGAHGHFVLRRRR